jgi:hypothetical protein
MGIDVAEGSIRFFRRAGDMNYSNEACRSFHPGEGCELVNSVTALRPNLYHRNVAYAQRIGHQRTMASPGHRLGAHDRHTFFAAYLNENFKQF